MFRHDTSRPTPATPDRSRSATVRGLWTAAAVFALSLAIIPTVLAEATTYGAGVRIEQATAIAEIAADPQAFEGQRVRVEGMVTDVCPRKGCWMSLQDGDAAVRIKVEDDVIVFPETAKGLHAVAEGIVEVLELDRDAYTSWLAHLAEEKGETFDPKSVGDGPYRLVQIRGDGAEIAGP